MTLFLQKKGHFLLFFTLTCIGHFLTNFYFFKIILLVDCIVHSLIDFHKEILKNKVMAMSRNMHVPPMSNAECHSSHGMFTTVDPMYIWQLMMKMIRTGGIKEFGMDGQQFSESGSDCVSHCMRERVNNKRCGQRDGFW